MLEQEEKNNIKLKENRKSQNRSILNGQKKAQQTKKIRTQTRIIVMKQARARKKESKNQLKPKLKYGLKEG